MTSAAVVIASAGRPQLLADVVEALGKQTWRDLTVVVSVPGPDSLPAGGFPTGVKVVSSTGGLAAQRNAGMDAAGGADVIVMFDDDSVVSVDFVECAVTFLQEHPDVCGLTGRVLLDGAQGGEISQVEADTMLASSARDRPGTWTSSRELYGCNMVIHVSRSAGERFDERLPLYSWLEDHDIARRLMRHGRLAKVADCTIVHRGVKTGGRAAHRRLGYSQVMNPIYLWRAGSFPWWLMLREIVPRTGKNLLLAAAGPDRSWRRKRAAGNALAFRDALRGEVTPERAAQIAQDA